MVLGSVEKVKASVAVSVLRAPKSTYTVVVKVNLIEYSNGAIHFSKAEPLSIKCNIIFQNNRVTHCAARYFYRRWTE